MFNSFHLQSEYCPNYIILNPSISCFNRSVVVIDPYSSWCISFQPECLHVLLVHCNPFFLMSFNLQGSTNVPCSYFLTECFQLCPSPLYSSFQFFNLSRLIGFTRLSKKQLCFTSSLPLLFAIPRSWGEISCKWRRVVTTRDRRSRCLPCILTFVM